MPMLYASPFGWVRTDGFDSSSQVLELLVQNLENLIKKPALEPASKPNLELDLELEPNLVLSRVQSYLFIYLFSQLG